jgi:hypothetical protein
MSTTPAGQPSEPPRDKVIPPTEAKDPVLVLVVALFLGGIAYFLIGQTQKGIAAVAAWLAAIVLAIVTCGVGIVIYLPLVVAIVVDAYMQAKALKDGHPIGQWTFFGNHL